MRIRLFMVVMEMVLVSEQVTGEMGMEPAMVIITAILVMAVINIQKYPIQIRRNQQRPMIFLQTDHLQKQM